LDFQRERRLAAALTRGFVPDPPAALSGCDVGLVYEPSEHDVGGGDLFGVWRLRGGALALLLGDVSGKGLEVAAMSAMVRFFIEARAFDSDSPAEVLAQANRILNGRLPAAGFATVFMAVVDGGRRGHCDARPPPPRVRRARGGGAGGGEVERGGGGVAVGVDRGSEFAERELEFAPGDTLFAATDGLLEARRERSFFGDARLPSLLAEHGRTLQPQALAELAQAE